jgi:hypothetical protein
MTQTTRDLVQQDGTISVSRSPLKQSCDLFIHEPALLTSPYHVRSSVSVDIFSLFVSAIEGSNPEFTPASGASEAALRRVQVRKIGR